ncbi:hypothetical protein BDV93DRAFT_513565 [Ceratobasidium sp. AG-I]|nr:hypothetical protein BDV93DRAFT_513565 [Ceratobasidium sp. AG-I]
MLRGEVETDAIWECNLNELDDVTGWNFVEDEESGAFTIQKATLISFVHFGASLKTGLAVLGWQIWFVGQTENNHGSSQPTSNLYDKKRKLSRYDQIIRRVQDLAALC